MLVLGVIFVTACLIALVGFAISKDFDVLIK